MMAKRWIQKAIKHPGALRKTAKSAGAITSKGKISEEWLRAKAKAKGLLGKRARLALTLKRLRKK